MTEPFYTQEPNPTEPASLVYRFVGKPIQSDYTYRKERHRIGDNEIRIGVIKP